MPRTLTSNTSVGSTGILAIFQGGTNADTAPVALSNLGGIPASSVDQPNGIASLDALGKVTLAVLGSGSGSSMTIVGVSSMNTSQTSIFTITNYDDFITYNLTAINGSVSRVGEVITYTAPAISGSGGFTINGKTVNINVIGMEPMKPTITSPANGSSGLSTTISFTSSAFAVASGSDTHEGSDWQVATDAGFTNIVSQVTNSVANKLGYTASGLSSNTTYYARVRYKGVTHGYGAWSNTTNVMTAFAALTTPTTEEGIIIASDYAAGDQFGYQVSMDATGDRVAVGAPNETNPYGQTGAVYVFKRSGTTWTQEAKIVSVISIASTISLTIPSGGSIRVQMDGASTYDQTHTSNASVPVAADVKVITLTGKGQDGSYTPGSGTWTWTSSGTPGPSYLGPPHFTVSAPGPVPSSPPTYEGQSGSGGYSQTIDSTYYYDVPVFFTGSGVTAPISTTGTASQASFNGNSYTFAGGSGGAASNTTHTILVNTGERFGDAVALSNDGATLVVGNYLNKNGTAVGAGSAFVHRRSGTTWNMVQALPTSGGVAAGGDYFGEAVSVSQDGTYVAVGARGAGTSDEGRAYIYKYNGSQWVQEVELSASDATNNSAFGISLCLDSAGSRIIIGAHTADTTVNGNEGAAYIFVRSGTSWTQEAKLLASDPSLSDYFGYPVTMSGDGTRVAINSRDKDVGGITDAGAVYIFVRSGTSWTQEAKLVETFMNRTMTLTIPTTGQVTVATNSPSLVSQVYTTSQNVVLPMDASSVTITGKGADGAPGSAGQGNASYPSGLPAYSPGQPYIAPSGTRIPTWANFSSASSNGSRSSTIVMQLGTISGYNVLDSTVTIVPSDMSINGVFEKTARIERIATGITQTLTFTFENLCGDVSNAVYSPDSSGSMALGTVALKAVRIDTTASSSVNISPYFPFHFDISSGYSSGIGIISGETLGDQNINYGIAFSTVSALGYSNPGQPYIAPSGDPSYPSGLPPYIAPNPGQPYIAPVAAHWINPQNIPTPGNYYLFDDDGSFATLVNFGVNLASGSVLDSRQTGAAGQEWIPATFELTRVTSKILTRYSIGIGSQFPAYVQMWRDSPLAMNIHANSATFDSGTVTPDFVAGVTQGGDTQINYTTLVPGTAGQPYVAPGANIVGSNTTVNFNGNNYTYNGGNGVAATPSANTINLDNVNNQFGRSISLNNDGSLLAIGVQFANAGVLTDAGVSYLFTRSGTAWTPSMKFSASNGAANDNFGSSVSLSDDGSRLAVGAYIADSGGQANAGSVYIFS